MRQNPSRPGWLVVLMTLATLLTSTRTAFAAGNLKVMSPEANEVSGAWHIYVQIDLPKAPLVAHQSMKFFFTKTIAFERSLVDGHDGPVTNRVALSNQPPSMESMDVQFADSSGKVFKSTRFDFGLTRARGYEAGEYMMEVRSSEGQKIGTPSRIVLKGDNPVVDRRSMNFGAQDARMTKVPGATAPSAPSEEPAPAAAPMTGEVVPAGATTGFVPKEGLVETEEEKLKVRPKGCGCSVPPMNRTEGIFAALAMLALPIVLSLRSRTRRASR